MLVRCFTRTGKSGGAGTVAQTLQILAMICAAMKRPGYLTLEAPGRVDCLCNSCLTTGEDACERPCAGSLMLDRVIAGVFIPSAAHRTMYIVAGVAFMG